MINPNEAPKGYVAVKAPSHGRACVSCAFIKYGAKCLDSDCHEKFRKDRTSVIFIPRESNLDELSVMTTAEAIAEAKRWKESHDHVCKELASCVEARDENAKLCEDAREELERTKNHSALWMTRYYEKETELAESNSKVRDLERLIDKLKGQLTFALETLAGKR